MKLNLIREHFTQKSTIGRLMLNGVFECYTLEDVVRPDGVKVFGETAIPAGIYTVIINHSHRFDRDLPRLLDVPKFDGILIHPGNTSKDTHGCVLVGTTKGVDWIGSSRLAFTALFDKLKAAKTAGEVITIEITGAP